MELLFYESDSESSFEIANESLRGKEEDDDGAVCENNNSYSPLKPSSCSEKIDYKFLRKQGINVRRYKDKIKLKECEMNIKKTILKRVIDFEELSKFNLERADRQYRGQIPHGCINWRAILNNDRSLYGFIVCNDPVPSRQGIHRFRLIVDDIFVADTLAYPVPPSVHNDSILESVKLDLNSLGITMDTRKKQFAC
jgi:hypothetical protein